MLVFFQGYNGGNQLNACFSRLSYIVIYRVFQGVFFVNQPCFSGLKLALEGPAVLGLPTDPCWEVELVQGLSLGDPLSWRVQDAVFCQHGGTGKYVGELLEQREPNPGMTFH